MAPGDPEEEPEREPAEGAAPDAASDPEIRELTDPRAMRALAHPVRVALLDAIRLEGPLTATKAAELLGESPGNMSWHLQTLAKYGFVTEAGGGRGRARPWKLVGLGMRISPGTSDDAESELAAQALGELFTSRQLERRREWELQRHTFAPEWRHAAFHVAATTFLTHEELSELCDEIGELLMRYRERTADHRPADARPVQLVSFGHPLPASDASDD
jgi:DNA-binding transcriptional ArsR family regulator